MPEFQVFTKRMVPLKKRPYVTIQKKGVISLNASAYHEMGEPEAVEFLFDEDAQIVGLRGVDPNVEHAYGIRENANSTSYLVSGTAFFKYFNVPLGITRRYDPEIIEGTLCIDLKGESTEVTSNRSKPSATADASAPEASAGHAANVAGQEGEGGG